jgi:hypothetical protein
MSTSPSIVIGVIPRERFALTGEVLRQIMRHTSQPYRLIVVDCAMPERFRQEIETILGGRPHAEVLHFDRYLLPNESRNRVIEATNEEYVCLIDNGPKSVLRPPPAHVADPQPRAAGTAGAGAGL